MCVCVCVCMCVCVCVCVCVLCIYLVDKQVGLRKVEGVTQMAPWQLIGSKMWVGDRRLRPTASKKGAEAV